jgi:Flp pilus assembly protein TadG
MIRQSFSRFHRSERGTTLVEFAIAISLFLLIFFAVLDFGRLAYNWVMAEKAMQTAARIAAVRPAVCAGVPEVNLRADAFDDTVPSGTLCRAQPGVCQAATPAPCTLAGANGGSSEAVATASEIWTAVRPFLPENATNANVLLRYDYSEDLGFLGGPYTPLITAELVGAAGDGGSFGDFRFTFITPLSALAATAGASDTTGVPSEGASIPFPAVSATIPAEDLNLGGRG